MRTRAAVVVQDVEPADPGPDDLLRHPNSIRSVTEY